MVAFTANQQRAYTAYTGAGLSDAGARAMIARGSYESGGGVDLNPNAVNSIGAIGIAQDLGSRQNGVIVGNLDNQLQHNITELQTGTDGSGGYAYKALQSNDPYTAATGASAFERAENYNPSTHTDILTDKTYAKMQTYDTTGQSADATPQTDVPQTAPADGTVVQTPSTAPDGTSTVQADPTAANPLGSLSGGLSSLVSQIPVVGPMLSGLLGGSSGGSSAYSPTPANPASDPIAIATGADEQSKTAAADTKAADDTATANTASVTGTANSIYGLTFGTLGDGAMRIALVVVGMICLAGALYLVASEQGQRVLSEA